MNAIPRTLAVVTGASVGMGLGRARLGVQQHYDSSLRPTGRADKAAFRGEYGVD